MTVSRNKDKITAVITYKLLGDPDEHHAVITFYDHEDDVKAVKFKNYVMKAAVDLLLATTEARIKREEFQLTKINIVGRNTFLIEY